MDKFELKGIWRGEYIYDDRFQPSFIKKPVPFIIKIKTVEDGGLFEGMCQDDPALSQIDFPADIYGCINEFDLIFNKKYPKTVYQDNFGNFVKTDVQPPDIIYRATISGNGKIYGTWKMEKTFRKVNDKIVEYGPITGVWWMDRY